MSFTGIVDSIGRPEETEALQGGARIGIPSLPTNQQGAKYRLLMGHGKDGRDGR